MKVDEIRLLESADILQKIEDQRQALFNLRLNWTTGALDNPNEMRVVRKDIARMLTVLRERELATEYVQDEQ